MISILIIAIIFIILFMGIGDRKENFYYTSPYLYYNPDYYPYGYTRRYISPSNFIFPFYYPYPCIESPFGDIRCY